MANAFWSHPLRKDNFLIMTLTRKKCLWQHNIYVIYNTYVCVHIYIKHICMIHICEIFIHNNCVLLAHSSSVKQGQVFTALWCRKKLKLAWCSNQKSLGKADMFRSCSKTVVLLVRDKWKSSLKIFLESTTVCQRAHTEAVSLNSHGSLTDWLIWGTSIHNATCISVIITVQWIPSK